MQVIIIKCANGVVAWTVQSQIAPGKRGTLKAGVDASVHFVCGRDGFTVMGPLSPSDVERAITQVAGHTVSIAGAIQQLLQVDI